jgi:hypothetical protein
VSINRMAMDAGLRGLLPSNNDNNNSFSQQLL